MPAQGDAVPWTGDTWLLSQSTFSPYRCPQVHLVTKQGAPQALGSDETRAGSTGIPGCQESHATSSEESKPSTLDAVGKAY